MRDLSRAREYRKYHYEKNREAILIRNKLQISLTEARELISMGKVNNLLVKIRERLIKRGSYPSA